ncbi:hypothetical protein [Erythrobacter donghaensis]|uniref:hypothetical protein n=1 Tax=Erythrobacter donghaensis TaxID=267135 RepID=UPI00093EE737|nr:hypothetical protein [Erythrobacter donghaensis]
MRGAFLGGSALILGTGAYVGGAFERGEYYEIAPVDVESRLAGMNFSSELSGESGDSSIRLALRSRGPSLLRWDLMVDGERAGEVRANLAPADTGTRVNVSFKFAEGDGMLGLEDDPLVNDIARIAMEEKVDSTLDGRAFDKRRMQAKMAAMIAANPGKLAAMQKSLRDNIEREMEEAERFDPDAYAASRDYGEPGSYGKPTSTARPTMSAKPQRPTDFEDTHADGGWGKN